MKKYAVTKKKNRKYERIGTYPFYCWIIADYYSTVESISAAGTTGQMMIDRIKSRQACSLSFVGDTTKIGYDKGSNEKIE